MHDPDTQPRPPIEITIRFDPGGAGAAIKGAAGKLWSLVAGPTAIVCYWSVAALVTAFIVAALVAEGVFSGRVLALPAIAGIVIAFAALKRRYSPLVRD